VVLLGDTHTGKTSLVLRFVEGHYKENRNATIGAFFLTKRLTLDSMTCKLLLWDTAGQEQFQKLAVTYYKQAAAAIVCYDVSGAIEDQIACLQKWLDQVQHNISNLSDHRIVTVVAACKGDLPATPGIEDEAKRIADRYGALYVKTSAKNNTNVSKAFTLTAEAVLQCQHEAATGRGRPIQVTVGGTSLRHRSFSPTGHGQGSSPGAVRTRTSSNAMGTAPTKSSQNQSSTEHHNDNSNNNTDSSTAGDSDDNLAAEGNGRRVAESSSGPSIMCDNGMLVCGEASGSECTLL